MKKLLWLLPLLALQVPVAQATDTITKPDGSTSVVDDSPDGPNNDRNDDKGKDDGAGHEGSDHDRDGHDRDGHDGGGHDGGSKGGDD